jgi:SAM-dependent methyltransferase
MNGSINFGYPWWLSYGHLCLVGAAAAVAWLAHSRGWRKTRLLFGVLALWAFGGFVGARFVMNVNGRASLPTSAFLASGQGRVLDMGAGTGRSSIMVLEARPQATLTALDLFGESYEHHFGKSGSPRDRLLANLKAAGVDRRATIQPGDMRHLPFAEAEFDAIVSAYAIDHLNAEGIGQSLAEAARVVKPGGGFLLMLVGKDPWLRFTFGPLMMHSGTHNAEWWAGRLREAGFAVEESGLRPGTLYLLARRV